MNQRNVEALARVIGACGIAPQHDSWAQAMAKNLAAAGVLVPSALTDEEARSAIDGGADVDLTSGGPTEYDFAWFRVELERIAKGEPG